MDTKKTESRAARAEMSEQETTCPQALEMSVRRSLMALKAAGRSVKLGGAFFSLGPPADPSNRIEPSQPCKHEPPTHTRARDLTVQLYDSIVHR